MDTKLVIKITGLPYDVSREILGYIKTGSKTSYERMRDKCYGALPHPMKYMIRRAPNGYAYELEDTALHYAIRRKDYTAIKLLVVNCDKHCTIPFLYLCDWKMFKYIASIRGYNLIFDAIKEQIIEYMVYIMKRFNKYKFPLSSIEVANITKNKNLLRIFIENKPIIKWKYIIKDIDNHIANRVIIRNIRFEYITSYEIKHFYIGVVVACLRNNNVRVLRFYVDLFNLCLLQRTINNDIKLRKKWFNLKRHFSPYNTKKMELKQKRREMINIMNYVS